MELEGKRKEIDDIDRAIVELLDRRSRLSRDIAFIKTRAGLPIHDRVRENDVIGRVSAAVTDNSIRESMEQIYYRILQESRRIQDEVLAQVGGIGIRS